MLFGQDPRRQRIHRVVFEDRHGGLQDDRSAIELGRHEVHGRTRDAHPVRERLPLRAQPWEGRQ